MKKYKASFVMNVDTIEEGYAEIEAESGEDARLRLTQYLENYPDGIDSSVTRFVVKKRDVVVVTDVEVKINEKN